MVTKQRYIPFSLDVVLFLSLHVHNRVENILKHVLIYVRDIKVMTEKIGLKKESSNKILLFTQLWVIPKLGNFYLPDWKPNIMSLYSDTTSCNSLLERYGGATSFSILPIKKSFLLFLYL